MRMRTVLKLALAVTCILGVAAPSEPGHAATRRSGTVVTLDPVARTLVVEEMGLAGRLQRVVVRIGKDAQIVVSERRPEGQTEDPFQPFRTTPIGLDALRPGDFVVIESTPGLDGEVAISVAVTFRGEPG